MHNICPLSLVLHPQQTLTINHNTFPHPQLQESECLYQIAPATPWPTNRSEPMCEMEAIFQLWPCIRSWNNLCNTCSSVDLTQNRVTGLLVELDHHHCQAWGESKQSVWCDHTCSLPGTVLVPICLPAQCLRVLPIILKSVQFGWKFYGHPNSM